jgi:hypothetical protein
VVESSGLLNRRRPLKSTGGSNPPLSARISKGLQVAESKLNSLTSQTNCVPRQLIAHSPNASRRNASDRDLTSSGHNAKPHESNIPPTFQEAVSQAESANMG